MKLKLLEVCVGGVGRGAVGGTNVLLQIFLLKVPFEFLSFLKMTDNHEVRKVFSM